MASYLMYFFSPETAYCQGGGSGDGGWTTKINTTDRYLSELYINTLDSLGYVARVPCVQHGPCRSKTELSITFVL